MSYSIKKYIYLSLTILTIVFIFYNSTRNGAQSTDASDEVIIILNKILDFFNLKININSLYIRKMAHFIEFFVLGLFITLTFNSFNNSFKQNIGFILFFSLLIPVLDETIQIFSVGRTSQVQDVIIDFLGSLTAVFITSLVLYFINKRNKTTYIYF